ncbi:hypothetical protein CEK25_004969 [Fusarium fujikuroi]|nr:hypothetical protein CEK25_004969 [Fusarium fujikuroi]
MACTVGATAENEVSQEPHSQLWCFGLKSTWIRGGVKLESGTSMEHHTKGITGLAAYLLIKNIKANYATLLQPCLWVGR